MKAVGVKQLKNQLSRYLKLVQEGELLYVTDHDEVIAEIHRPLGMIPGRTSRWESFINELELRGAIKRAKIKRINAKEKLAKDPAKPIQVDWTALMAEIRRDRL